MAHKLACLLYTSNEESADTSSDLKNESSNCDNLEKTVQVESNVEDDEEVEK